MPAFPKVVVQEKEIRFLTEDEQNEIFEFIKPEDKPIFVFLKFTGARPNEAGAIQKSDVNWKNKTFVIQKVLAPNGELKYATKTKKLRVLEIIPELEEALKFRGDSNFVFTWNGGRPYRTKLLERIWNRANGEATKKYGTPTINLYNGLKHSFVMQRLQDYPLDKIRPVLGHGDVKTTMKYGRYQTGQLAEVMRGGKHGIAWKSHGQPEKSSSENHSEIYEKNDVRHRFDPCSAYQVEFGLRISG